MIRAVIFDMDGTLVDSVDHHARAWQQAFQHFGIEAEYAHVRSQIGKGGDQLMPVFLDEEQLESMGEKIEAFRTKLYQSKYLPKVTAFAKVRELFLHLKSRDVHFALASSASEEDLAALMKVARIDDLIEISTSSDDAERSKPYPDIFEAALNQLKGIPAEDCVVIGDSPYDAQAAGKIGLKTVGVLSGGFAPEELREAGCVALYRDPADLLAHARPTPDAWLEGSTAREHA